MSNFSLLKYILDARSQGFSDDAINETLLKSGWQQSDIEAAMNTIQPTPYAAETQLPNTSSARTRHDITSVRFLGYGLLLDVVGFGMCTLPGGNENMVIGVSRTILSSVAHLGATVCCLICLRYLRNTRGNIFKKIFLFIAALAIGGWGLIWGVVVLIILAGALGSIF